jgi:gliding motility-associated-like protein
VTASDALSGNFFNSDVAGPGNYHFKYRVDGLCGFFDETDVEISVKVVPETPIAFLEQDVCDGKPLQLLATTIAGASYQWSGPNGFASSEQNPLVNNVSVLNNGTYTVTAFVDQCPSATSSIEVAVSPSLEFALDAACNQNAFTVSVIPLNGSFDAESVSYSWTGPENYTGSGNPIVITGMPTGAYEVTVTDGEACPVTANVDVPNTLCEIPKGISPNNDDANDSFDLTGFDVKNVKIFNRYGAMVFERENYVDQWRGQDYLGHELPSATYYYLVNLMSGETKSGWVYLIRD